MSIDRRSFLRTSALAGGALAAGALGPSRLEATTPRYRDLPDVPAAPRTLDLLILGGTGFTGPYQVRYAVARGHRVTVFNRGRSQADLPEGVEQLSGDRHLGELDALRGRSWDAVIDNPTTLPFWVRDVGRILRDSTGLYTFISTISAYRLEGAHRIDEESELLVHSGGDPLEVTPAAFQENPGGLYGPMKAESEREAARWFGDGTTIIRPGLIVGPGDQSDRFTYWPRRIARGGEILAPGSGSGPVQIIDARDLAEWTVRLMENGTTGTFNGVGPRSVLSMAEQLHGIRGALSGDLDLHFTWVPQDFLREHDVRPWTEMTTWVGDDDVLSRVTNARAVGAGLTFRPLSATAQDTLEWYLALPPERQAQPRSGLDPEKEEQVLRAWRARGG
jgi:2'-hydroxyisoflavone reductase